MQQFTYRWCSFNCYTNISHESYFVPSLRICELDTQCLSVTDKQATFSVKSSLQFLCLNTADQFWTMGEPMNSNWVSGIAGVKQTCRNLLLLS